MSQLPIHVTNTAIISAGDVSTATITSSTLEVKEIRTFAVQAVWSGASPLGTLSIQGSNDGTNFKELSGGSIAVSGNTGNDLKNFPDCGYAYVQAVYTKTSGTGTITVTVNGKR
jgi:hypothetical protein